MQKISLRQYTARLKFILARRYITGAQGHDGFTLVEVLVAIFITSLMLSGVYGTYTRTAQMIKETEYQVTIYKKACVAFQRIIEDLDSTVLQYDEIPLVNQFSEILPLFQGNSDNVNDMMAGNMNFYSYAHLQFQEDEEEYSKAKISFSTETSEESGEKLILFRSDNALDENKEGIGDEKTTKVALCDELIGVKFTFIDEEGVENDAWPTGGENGDKLPRMVTIALMFAGFADKEKPLQFSTSIVLPVLGKNG